MEGLAFCYSRCYNDGACPRRKGDDVMTILDMIVPGRAKANLRRDIEELNEIALRESQRLSLPPKRAVLWEALCNGASDLVVHDELFVGR